MSNQDDGLQVKVLSLSNQDDGLQVKVLSLSIQEVENAKPRGKMSHRVTTCLEIDFIKFWRRKTDQEGSLG